MGTRHDLMDSRCRDRISIISSLVLAVATVIQSFIVCIRGRLSFICEVGRITVLRGVARFRLCDAALGSTTRLSTVGNILARPLVLTPLVIIMTIVDHLCLAQIMMTLRIL